MRSTPDDIVVREEDWWAFIKVGRSGSETTVLRHQQVEDDLLIRCPIARIGEHEDGVNVDLSEVADSRVLVFFLCELAEGRSILVVFDDVSWSDAGAMLVDVMDRSYGPTYTSLKP